MAQQVSIWVLGFSQAERHALNTVFRLSTQAGLSYVPWQPSGGSRPPQLALIDGESYEARVALATPAAEGLPLFWVGPGAPPQAVFRCERPIPWPQVVQAMDQHLMAQAAPAVAAGLDLDLDLGAAWPDTAPGPEAPARPILLASADPDLRLYLRARAALAGLHQIDEAPTAAEALRLVGLRHYPLVLVDLGLPDAQGGWPLLRTLRQAQPPIAQLLGLRPLPGPLHRARARLAGWRLLGLPPDPYRLAEMLLKV